MRAWLYHNNPIRALFKLIFYWPFVWFYAFAWRLPVAIFLYSWYGFVYIITLQWIGDIYKVSKGTATNKEKLYVGLALAFIAFSFLSWLVNG